MIAGERRQIGICEGCLSEFIMLNPIIKRQDGIIERILVVDDSRETVNHLMNNVLKPSGYETMFALDGQRALEEIRGEKPDLVLLDLNMPNMGGMDVLDNLMDDAYRPPVILMTGDGSEEVAIEAFRLGVRDYLVKPFTKDEVVDLVRSVLDRCQTNTDSSQQADEQALSASEQRWYDLLNVSKVITSLTDKDKIMRQVVRSAADVCHADSVAMTLCLTGQTELLGYTAQNDVFEHLENVKIDPLTKQVVERRDVCVEEDSMMGVDVGLGRPARAGMAAPIWSGDEIIGVLTIAHTQKAESFDEQNERFLLAICDYATIALANAEKIDGILSA